MAEPMDAIDQIIQGNNVGFQDAINSILMDRAKENIANQKMVVMNKIFSDEESSEDTEEITDTADTEEQQTEEQ